MDIVIPPPEVPADRAVPAGRIGYDLAADPLLVHSLLSPTGYAVLADKGVLRADPRLVEPGLRRSYDWLRGQMRSRVAGARGRYPLWFWAKIGRRDLLGHVRHAARQAPGTVLVTCRVPRARCLLSNYDDWHSVLSGSFCIAWTGAEPTAGPDLDAYDRRLDETYGALAARLAAVGLARGAPVEEWPLDVRRDLETSWELIFDVGRYHRRSYWQATVEELYAAEVTAAVAPVI